MFNRAYIRIIPLLATVCFLAYCQTGTTTLEETPPYENWAEHVKYVGMETCRGCHTEIYDTYIRTGMGQSWYHATPDKSKAVFDEHALVYDSTSNFYYQPYWVKDSLFIKEFRLENGDTTHAHDQYVKYIVGSGQHTNSHIYDENGYLYQAPITFYTQKGIWSLAPGFEGGFSSRFNRIIGRECINCHNAHPTPIDGSENKYLSVPLGIDCERCHGPGEIHVKKKKKGDIIDTSKYIDYSIVNPGKLSRERQLNLCQRCHLQGVSILKDGKEFHDFRPGQYLWETMDIYLPEYDGGETQFIMASQAHRMEKSECFKMSEMTCLTCHDPHVSVNETSISVFNQACMNCHNQDRNNFCTLDESSRAKNENNCSGCHMPESGSIDIPHVTITDHFIRIPLSEEEKQQEENFVGLKPATHGEVTEHSQAQAYINFFERFTSDPAYLDSAQYYLEQSESRGHLLPTRIHLLYLQNDFVSIRSLAEKADKLKKLDGWTAYRLGEAFYDIKDYTKAEKYFRLATEDLHLQLDFQNKLGSTLTFLNRLPEAEAVFQFILEQDTRHLSALSNLGFLLVNSGKFREGAELYDRAIALNPDYVPALLNKAALLLHRNKVNEAKPILQHVLKVEPNNTNARTVLESI